jgi:putative ABC transport system permease protein
VDATLVPEIEAVDGVNAAEGQVVAQIRVLDREGKPLVSSQGPPNFGLNWLTSPDLNGWNLVEGGPPAGSTEIVLDAKTAADGGYAVGDPVSVSVTNGVQRFTVVGIARFGKLDTWGGAQAALFDTATAQAIVGEPG